MINFEIKNSVLILAPPRWIIEPTDVEAMEGEEISLFCLAEGLPSPKYVWKKSESEFKLLSFK